MSFLIKKIGFSGHNKNINNSQPLGPLKKEFDFSKTNLGSINAVNTYGDSFSKNNNTANTNNKSISKI